jgi:DNA (cytosine-5)-methyltransferase 1
VSAEGIAPTLAHSSNTHGGHHQPWVVADTVRSHPRPGSNSTGAVAFTERTRSEGRNLETQEELAYALTNPGSGGRTHSRQLMQGMAVRRLTPTECERLQGFPDGWTAGTSDSARYRMLGNAVCVTVAEWIWRRVITVHNERGWGKQDAALSDL